MRNVFLFLFSVGTIIAVIADIHHHRVPVLDLHGADRFEGTVREDQRVVFISPELRLIHDTGPVCAYELAWNAKEKREKDIVPFLVDVTDTNIGEAVVRVRNGVSLDCSIALYELALVAIRCHDRAQSESIPLDIAIHDTNNHVPEFSQPWFIVNVDEGRIYPEITRLTATDDDCGPPYGIICRYELTNSPESSPFVVSDQGVLRNTRPLNHSESRSHLLSVVAVDCGMRASKPALLSVNVQLKACVQQLRGLAPNADYFPRSGAKYLAPEVDVELCPDECTPIRIETAVTLEGNQCDHDLNASKERRRRCGLHPDTVEFLPHPQISNDDASEPIVAKDEDYYFDGEQNAVLVPPSTARPLVPGTFTLSFSMKHLIGTKKLQRKKQNILCETDDAHMNRHHFAVYLRHCKLELLFRRENEKNHEEHFRAAEWRWNLPQVCDGQWHHYAILFHNVDRVDLYVDDHLSHMDDKNVEILDDVPLHNTRNHKTRLVVGACWHGLSKKMAQFFRGHLAGMLYLPGKTERPTALDCLRQCGEQLQFNGLDKLVSGEAAFSNYDLSSLTVRARTASGLSRMLRKVAYSDERRSPSSSFRSFHFITTIHCVDGKTISLPPSESVLNIVKPANPTVKLTATQTVVSNREDLKNGVVMLNDIEIAVVQPGSDGNEHDTSRKHRLNWCRVHLKPARDPVREYFSSPAALIADSHLDFEHDIDGLTLSGDGSVDGYREVLSKIHYFNVKSEHYTERVYIVQCAMLNGSIRSNELMVKMRIEAPKKELNRMFDDSTAVFNRRLVDIPGLARPKVIVGNGLYDDAKHGSIVGWAVSVVVMLGIGLLLVLLFIGVIRIRDPTITFPRRRRRKTSAVMEWDDSGMNIIVNPMDESDGGSKTRETKAVQEGHYSVDDSSDGDSYHGDELSEDDDVEQVLPHSKSTGQNGSTGLEWDDSTLTQSAHTYHV